jgi:hypothetical protein
MSHRYGLWLLVLSLLAGCATSGSVSEDLYGTKYPHFDSVQSGDTAHITFSSDKKYESEDGVPFPGDPMLCRSDGIYRLNPDNQIRTSSSEVDVRAGEKIGVGSMITWQNGMWKKSCWPFVAFVPEAGAKYVVVNERIGGKGLASLVTGVAFQSCEVSVFKESGGAAQKIAVEKVTNSACQPMTKLKQQ